jgi:CubicO group peptidase (beta-lactamase class C family)
MTNRFTHRLAPALGIALLAPMLAGACTTPPAPPGPPPVYPGTEWEHADATAAGFDPAVLDDLAAEAEAADSNCLVVTRHGKIVADWYWKGTGPGTTQEVFSVTKSLTSTLVGLAQADGDLDLDDPAADSIPAWAGTPAAAVTVEDLISNDSGRHWDLNTDYVGLTTAGDRTAFAVGLGQDAAPGQVWAYNNAAIQTLDAVLEATTGQQPADMAAQRVLGPIGMADSRMTRDPSGNTNTYFGLQSSCEDLARFGYLFLRDGMWDGQRIVPADWVDAATGAPSQEVNAAYGYLWWINHLGPLTGPLDPMTLEQAATRPDQRVVPSAPEGMYWAQGLGGQVVQVDPGSDTVVVRLGPGTAGSSYGMANTARVVTEALVRP